MRPERAWVRLQSGRRLDLLDPHPDSWEDSDLAIGLSHTYRWGGHSRWELPLSVAQHSLLVLALRQQMQPNQPLSPGHALRELLHDGHEGFLSFDPISPVKPHLGANFEDVANQLQGAIDDRYKLRPWTGEDLVLHKRADRLAAASEAVHVAGWSFAELYETLNITLAPELEDPLPQPRGFRPWEPWPPKLAASLFLFKLRQLASPDWGLEHPAALQSAIIRQREIAALAEAFGQLPAKLRLGLTPPAGSILYDTWVFTEGHHGQEHVEGIVVGGERDESGRWLLDHDFTIFTDDQELVVCHGYNCHVVVE